jgi:hypothetical protein
MTSGLRLGQDGLENGSGVRKVHIIDELILLKICLVFFGLYNVLVEL